MVGYFRLDVLAGLGLRLGLLWSPTMVAAAEQSEEIQPEYETDDAGNDEVAPGEAEMLDAIEEQRQGEEEEEEAEAEEEEAEERGLENDDSRGVTE